MGHAEFMAGVRAAAEDAALHGFRLTAVWCGPDTVNLRPGVRALVTEPVAGTRVPVYASPSPDNAGVVYYEQGPA